MLGDEILETLNLNIYFKYKFRECNAGEKCPEYFEIFAEIDNEVCESKPERPGQRAKNNKNARVAKLVSQFFGEKADGDKAWFLSRNCRFRLRLVKAR